MVKLPVFEVNLKPIKNYIAGAPRPVHHWCSWMVHAPTLTSSLRWHVDVQTRPKFRRTGACSGSAAHRGQLHIAGPLGAFDVVEDCEAARDNSRKLLAVGGGLPMLAHRDGHNLFGHPVTRRLGGVSCGLNHGGNAADFGPDPECLGPGGSVLGGSGVIAAEVEEIIDLIVG